MSANRRTYFLAVAAAVVLAAALFLAREAFDLYNAFHSDFVHYDNNETELVLTNTTSAKLRLFRAGNNMDDAELILDTVPDRVWLAAGEYFIEADDDGRQLYYPVTIRGYRQGTEDDGSFLLTIRPMPEIPPAIPGTAAKLMPVPSGSFLFGDRLKPRQPHFVWVQSFYISDFETTNAAFRQFMDAPDGFRDDSNWTIAGRFWKPKRQNHTSAELRAGDEDLTRFGGDDMPVTRVTWYEAAAYCRWLTRRLGEGKWIYSLPTEAEWEKAARGPDNFEFSLGNELSDAETGAYNWKKNPLAERTVFGFGETLAGYRRNRYGLYHMGGNVGEWTQSLYLPFNQDSPWTIEGRNGDDVPGSRVARGGSWYSASNALLQIAYRDSFQPELSHHDLGFRVVARRIPGT